MLRLERARGWIPGTFASLDPEQQALLLAFEQHEEAARGDQR